MRNLEKFWCNDHLEEVAGDCGRYFPGDPRPLQAVERTHRQVKLLNGHLQNLFFAVVILDDHNLRIVGFVGEVYEEIEMLVEDLGSQG